MKTTRRIWVGVACLGLALAGLLAKAHGARAEEPAPFPHAQAMFEKVKDELLKSYVDDHVTEEELYQYAVRGMLDGLNRGDRKWNRLYTPAEYRELMNDLSGKVVGVGIEISADHDEFTIPYVLPGTPAERAGIHAGDRLLKVQGKSLRGKNLREATFAIRGNVGESVSLTLLQGDRVTTKTVRREPLPWSTVESIPLPGQLTLVTVREFNDRTPTFLRQALEKAAADKTRALILDLRGNQGGVLERMEESVSLLVPDGTPIVTALRRDGRRETHASRGTPVFTGRPLTILVDKETACGAEMMAATLKRAVGAVLVGEHTLGKWSGQLVDELPNGYAVKYTTALFLTPNGEALDGVGLEPDVRVLTSPDNTCDRLRHEPASKRLVEDAPLKAAVEILKVKLG